MDVIGQRTHASASLELVQSTALPVRMRGKVRELVRLYVPDADRLKGYASQLLHDVCREADKANVILFLTAASPELCAYYTRFGFMPIQAQPILMARMASSEPRTVKPISKAIEALH